MLKVSVLMPAYNAEIYIKEAIDSILDQTFQDYEFIIINDGSTDHTKDIILSYEDERIVYLENEKNSGIVATLNKGLDAARGEYIARMDADDVSIPERLEKQVEYMDLHPNIGVLGSGIQVFGDGIEGGNRVFTTDSRQLKAELIFSCCIAHPTVTMRTALLRKNNLVYDMDFAGAEDYNMWWRIAKFSEISTLPDILHKYRIHKNQITQDRSEKHILLMKKMLDLRFDDIGLCASEEEKQVFLKYCIGEFSWFNDVRIKAFVDVLKKIIMFNCETRYFNSKALCHVFELAILYTLDNSQIDENRKNNLYKYAVKTGIITNLMRFKMIYHRKYIG